MHQFFFLGLFTFGGANSNVWIGALPVTPLSDFLICFFISSRAFDETFFCLFVIKVPHAIMVKKATIKPIAERNVIPDKILIAELT